MPIVSAIVVLLTLNALGQAQVQPGAQTAPPPRDQTTQNARGTSGLKGRVVDGDNGRPLRRASVSIAPVDRAGTRKSTSTGLDGTYEFKDLPEGSYRISVTRGGYLPLEYGQRRPGELGRPVDVAEGAVLDKLDFALPRMGVITGRISDELGEPIEGVTVLAMRSLYSVGRRTLVPIGSPSIVTDDAGEYRIPRLPPGKYYVMASTKETWRVVENGKETLFGYLPTYFPGVSNGAEGRAVTLGIGQQVSGIDLSLIPGKTARVSGHAVDSEGKPFKQASLNQEIRGLDFGSFRGGPSATISGDGSFTIPDVPPGDYVLTVSRSETEGSPEVAQIPVTVDGSDLENISLVGSGGGTVSGHVVTDEAGLDLHAVRVTIGPFFRGQPSPAVVGTFRNGGFSLVTDDGAFAAKHVFGRSRFQINLPSGWIVKSITHSGREIADSSFELASGEEWNDVEVRVTKRSGTITGDIVNDQNAPVVEGTVVLFSTDNQKWFDSTRYVRATRPNQQGQWRVTGLPEGEYFVAAVDYVENGEWNDPEYLTSLRDVAAKLSVSEAGSATAHLKIVAPKH